MIFVFWFFANQPTVKRGELEEGGSVAVVVLVTCDR